MKLIWLTDIHLDFIDDPTEPCSNVEKFGQFLNNATPDGVLITGDISLAPTLVSHLRTLSKTLNKPIYFVCGNHDFYDGSFSSLRDELKVVCTEDPNLRYLTQSEVISLSENVALVGHDGWYDARHGDPQTSEYVMSDWLRISEYTSFGAITSGPYGMIPAKDAIVEFSRQHADQAAEYVRIRARYAARNHKVVVIATHIPPFVEVHNMNPKTGHSSAFPWYTSKIMGDVIREVAKENPDTRFEVFCGHTHGKCDIQLSQNVFCHVGGAQYGMPAIVGTLQLP